MKRDRQSVNLRHAEMLALIRKRQEVLVDELSEIFNISPMTVRRDLQLLEEQGTISRFHGGASSDLNAAAATEKVDVAVCRRLIAQHAALQVRDGSSLLINGSDTALALLDYLDGKHVTVYTNNGHAIGRALPKGIELHIFGGTPHFGHILTGDMTLRNLMDVNVDYAFLGCTGISPEGEVLCGIPAELGINETMIAHAKTYFILADHTKVGRSSPFASFHLEKKGCVITDAFAPAHVAERLRASGMEVVCVKGKPLEPDANGDAI